MVIESIRIRNYKSWKDSGDVSLSKGLNIVVGKNNSGKTAFLEGLSLIAENLPHATIRSKPEAISHLDPFSQFQVNVNLEAADIQSLFTELRGQIFTPLIDVNIPLTEAVEYINRKLNESQTITAEFQGGNLQRAGFVQSFHLTPKRFILCTRKPEDNNLILSDPGILNEHNIGTNELSRFLIEVSRKRIFLSKAERFNVSNANIQNSNKLLDQNSANLAQVLHTLHTNYPGDFKK